MDEELLGAQRTKGRKDARSWRATATGRVHCGGGVRENAAAVIGVQEDTTFTRLGERGAGRHAASQEKDHIAVVAARPQGTASALWSLFAGGGRTCTASTGYGSCNRPGVYSGPVRRGDSARNTRQGTSSKEKELKGESNANVPDGGIGTQNFAGAGAENIL